MRTAFPTEPGGGDGERQEASETGARRVLGRAAPQETRATGEDLMMRGSYGQARKFAMQGARDEL